MAPLPHLSSNQWGTTEEYLWRKNSKIPCWNVLRDAWPDRPMRRDLFPARLGSWKKNPLPGLVTAIQLNLASTSWNIQSTPGNTKILFSLQNLDLWLVRYWVKWRNIESIAHNGNHNHLGWQVPTSLPLVFTVESRVKDQDLRNLKSHEFNVKLKKHEEERGRKRFMKLMQSFKFKWRIVYIMESPLPDLATTTSDVSFGQLTLICRPAWLSFVIIIFVFTRLW